MNKDGKLVDRFGLDSEEREGRKRFLQFSEEDVKALKALLPLIRDNIEAIIEPFYRHLLSFPEACGFFEDESQLERVKAMQREYLLDLFRGDYGEDYFERRLQIGIVHEGIGLPTKWYYGSYPIFLELILSLIWRKYRFRPGKIKRATLALLKIMNLDQQLVTDTYIASYVEKLRATGRRIKEMSIVLASATKEISVSLDNLAANTEQTATSVNEITTTMEEVNQTAELAFRKAEDIAVKAKDSMAISEQGQQSVGKTIKGVKLIGEQMDSIAESILRVSDRSQAIEEINNAVKDLSEQSNLLAVNAAIEAARAGEQGKGFGVVAREVRNLSRKSKEATHHIMTILNEIQKAVKEAVLVAEEGGKSVKAEIAQSEETGQSIETLAETIADSVTAATQISASTRQQKIGTEQLGAGMRQLQEASAANLVGLQEIKESASDLEKLGNKLSKLMEGFKNE